MSLPSYEKIIDPNFINAELIGEVGAERVVTIKDIDLAECYDEQTKSKVQKASVFFEECKPMVLNKTNAKTLKRLFSPNSDNPADAFGHKVILKVENVKAFGKTTTGIRIKEYSEEKCPVCGKAILPYAGKTVAEIKEISKRNLGEVMCSECMKKKAKEGKDAE
jgi:hypothetical protein